MQAQADLRNASRGDGLVVEGVEVIFNLDTQLLLHRLACEGPAMDRSAGMQTAGEERC